MVKDLSGEKWKKVNFGIRSSNNYILEVSNFGRLRATNSYGSTNLLKGSSVNGYQIIRVKLFAERSESSQRSIDSVKRQIAGLNSKYKKMVLEGVPKKLRNEVKVAILDAKEKLSRKHKEDAQFRTRYFQKLTHRLVAELFLPKPSAKKTIVAHLDHNKLNNRADNLKWMTPEDNVAHQQKSPIVIKEKKIRKLRFQQSSKTAKLNAEKVAVLKKMLKEGKAVKELVKRFKVTDTQIARIKHGVNWSNIPAAK